MSAAKLFFDVAYTPVARLICSETSFLSVRSWSVSGSASCSSSFSAARHSAMALSAALRASVADFSLASVSATCLRAGSSRSFCRSSCSSSDWELPVSAYQSSSEVSSSFARASNSFMESCSCPTNESSWCQSAGSTGWRGCWGGTD